MSYDEGLLARCLDLLDALIAGEVRHKNVFGMRGLLRGKRMFAAVGEESMIVKVVQSEYQGALRNSGIRPFEPGGQKLGTWIEIDQATVADDPELREWLEAGLRAIR
jgi:TfoX/Sxy family transcriptional regulator of competence genes